MMNTVYLIGIAVRSVINWRQLQLWLSHLYYSAQYACLNFNAHLCYHRFCLFVFVDWQSEKARRGKLQPTIIIGLLLADLLKWCTCQIKASTSPLPGHTPGISFLFLSGGREFEHTDAFEKRFSKNSNSWGVAPGGDVEASIWLVHNP